MGRDGSAQSFLFWGRHDPLETELVDLKPDVLVRAIGGSGSSESESSMNLLQSSNPPQQLGLRKSSSLSGKKPGLRLRLSPESTSTMGEELYMGIAERSVAEFD